MKVLRGIAVLFLGVVVSGFGQTNQSAFFRISSPSNGVITGFDPVAGTLTYSNAVAGATNQIQRSYDLAGTSNWVDFVQLVATESVAGTERIIDLNPPEGMVLIPGGMNCGTNPLAMGKAYDPLYYPSSYSLAITAFYMDRHEVTNDEMVDAMQWAYDNGKLIMSSTSVINAQGTPQELLDLDDNDCRIIWDGSTFGIKPGKGLGYPCVEVSWYGAVAFCNYRSEMEGFSTCYNMNDWSVNLNAGGYRLPTDVEWEMAARGGLNGKRFEWGDTISHSKANYYGRSGHYSYDSSDGVHPLYGEGGYPYTSPVEAFDANGYGLYDMVGNVWEWCNDWYPGYEGSRRMLCGGSWSGYAGFCRSAFRVKDDPAGTGNAYGFRSVLPAEQ